MASIDISAALDRVCKEFAERQLAKFAQEAERKAKADAKWETHTRINGLQAGIVGDKFYNEGKDMGITLGFSQWYGLFVEKVHGPPNPDPKKRHDRDWWENWASTGEAIQYLENADDSKYAVLKPTLDALLPEIQEELRRVFIEGKK
jgi:hypothetical protein